jgi:uncharacterized protein YraI
MKLYWYGHYRFQVIGAVFWWCGIALLQLIIVSRIPILDFPLKCLKIIIPAYNLAYPLIIHFKRKRELARGIDNITSQYYGKVESKSSKFSLSRKVLLTILISIGLVIGVFTIVPVIKNGDVRTSSVPSASSSAQARFMLVNSDALNVRGGPSTDHNVVGQLGKNTRVQVLDSSGQWWKVRSGNIEGYVNSSFLIEEKTPSAPTSSSAPVSPTPVTSSGMGTTRSHQYQREWEEAYDRAPPVIPSNLVLPSGETVEERVQSGRVYGK